MIDKKPQFKKLTTELFLKQFSSDLGLCNVGESNILHLSGMDTNIEKAWGIGGYCPTDGCTCNHQCSCNPHCSCQHDECHGHLCH